MTRPTADRVRQTIFNVLGQRCDELDVLDLFAGTGALGLEAMSRGARRAVLVDSGREAAGLCRENARALGFADRVEVLQQPALAAIELLGARGDRFQLVFSDPPYASRAGAGILEAVGPLVTEGGVAVIEHEADEVLPERVGAWAREDERSFGSTVASLFRRTA